MNFNTPRTISTAMTWLFTGITLGAFLIFSMIAMVDPAHFEHLSRKDDHGDTGVIEHLTVMALVPAILLSAFSLIRWHRRLPSRWIAIWLALWTLACVYFAGEEASWGQWYFGFETPDAIEELNDQREMNLHNMSTWLDQKPRAMVKAFIILGGLVLPFVMHLQARQADGMEAKLAQSKRQWLDVHLLWMFAPPICWTAAGIVVFQRLASWIDQSFFDRVGDSEFRELGIAWFLSLYLLSYFLRLQRAASTTGAK